MSALVQVRLDPWTRVAEFVHRLVELPCVREAMVPAGDHDLAVVIDCADLTDLDATIRQLRAIGAEETVTQIVLRTVPGPDREPGAQQP
jgi:DNA-binding Lrp family transcriptional regulator